MRMARIEVVLERVNALRENYDDATAGPRRLVN